MSESQTGFELEMLSPDQLNEMDEWILDFLGDHEWAAPGLIRVFYIDFVLDDEEDDVSRQWVSSRVRRLTEHGHLEQVHPGHATYRLVSDPRDASQREREKVEVSV